MQDSRIGWVDSFKFLGIYAIYLGHFGHASGNAYDFVFRYHVALFFFAAGFFVKGYKNESLVSFVINKAKAILIPYFIFCFITILLISISESWKLHQLFDAIKIMFYGVRNDSYVGSLWFLNCIFVTLVIDSIFIRIVKNKWLVLFISALSLIYTQGFMDHNPRVNPLWFWNIDSALSFWFFLSAGRCSFEFINTSKMFNISSRLSYPFILITAIIALLYFYEGSGWLLNTARKFVNDKDKTSWFTFMLLYSTIGSLVLISFNIYIAKIISKINFLKKIGSNTLSICGLENSIKLIIPKCLILFGLDVQLKNPLSTYIYTFLCLTAAYYLSIYLKKHIGLLAKP